MSYIKKRVPRKPGSTTQEILADQRNLSHWFTENLRTVVFATGAVLLVLVITLGITWMKRVKGQAATEALSGAMALYKVTVDEINDEAYAATKDLLLALESLDKVASEYDGSPQGDSASLFRANVLFRLERYEEAAETIKTLNVSNPTMAGDVNTYYLLARSYEAMGDLGKAIETYRESSKHASGDMSAVIEIDLARCHELIGEKETAISIYRDILSEYPDTVFATRAEKKLATLGVADQETL